ncbi:hypothetical protein E4M16_09790 [Ligilactobacillus ruminis]|nr:hypothetical protein E4M16_09790 [Ligilactobacillus ruminis]
MGVSVKLNESLERLRADFKNRRFARNPILACRLSRRYATLHLAKKPAIKTIRLCSDFSSDSF